MEAIDAANAIRATHPHIGVAVLSQHTDASYALALLTNAGIEQAVHLSASTVEKHVNSIFAKLGLAEEPVHRRVTAVLAFLREPRPDQSASL